MATQHIKTNEKETEKLSFISNKGLVLDTAHNIWNQVMAKIYVEIQAKISLFQIGM